MRSERPSRELISDGVKAQLSKQHALLQALLVKVRRGQGLVAAHTEHLQRCRQALSKDLRGKVGAAHAGSALTSLHAEPVCLLPACLLLACFLRGCLQRAWPVWGH